ncbi:MAG: exodeoxyribonuclease V subunit beta [Deltaproteobacteria bacterium]|jgi:exodeoxyribonuclease V beta subunit|nr:exodeoxyribonuclease V subunit beta [Deltaproteobacteria bacterium]
MPSENSHPSQPAPFDLIRTPLAGINLIDASAGTGKTYTICGLVLRLLLEKDLSIEQILVVTYTEAATEDLRGRIRQLMRQALDALIFPANDEFLQKYIATVADHKEASRRLSDAIRSFDEAAIFTIHGFCQRMLLENSFESNTLFDTELVPDASYLVQEIIKDFWRRTFSGSSDLFCQYAADKLTPDKLQEFLAPLLPHPFIRFTPAIDFPAGCAGFSDSEMEYIDAYSNVCRKWAEAGPEVSDDLRNSPRLKRNIYKMTTVSGLISEMTAMAAACSPSLDLFDKFILFTAGKIKSSTKTKETPHIMPFYEQCELLYQAREKLATGYDICLLALKKRLLDSLGHELDSRKNRDNVFSFDDLLRRLHGALSGAAGSFLAQAIAKKYPAALIDEFQDTDPMQYDIFKAIYNRDALLFLIGDPKQAIYSFRGADIHTYMDAASSASLVHHTLGVNYRSDPQLVKAVNTIFHRTPKPFVFETISFQPVAAAQKEEREFLTINGRQEEPFVLCYLASDPAREDGAPSQFQNEKITKAVARELIISRVTAEVAGLLQLASENRLCIGGRKVAPGDIAILVRKNTEARKMQQALADIRVASVMHSGDDLFTSEEARELSQLLGAIAAPGNVRRLKTALLTRYVGLRADEINLLGDDPDNERTMELWLTRFKTYHELWQHHGFMRMFWTVMYENRVRQRMLASENGERILTNILHLAEILHQEAVNSGHNMAALLGYLQNRLAGDGTGNIEHQLRLESDEDRVKIVTIHKAKGLEYPIVFCPFTWEGTRLNAKKGFLFHRSAGGGKTELVYEGGSPELDIYLQCARQEELAENLRLLYVGLTRGVHRCYLFWGPINGAETSAPAYLLHQDPAALQDPKEAALGDIDRMHKAANRFLRLTEEEILTDLHDLAAASDNSIRIATGKDLPESCMTAGKEDAVQLRSREFTGIIPRDWKISSFSSLTGQRAAAGPAISVFQDETPDRDALAAPLSGAEDLTETKETDYNIFSFPQGAKPGTFLHELLEQADFSSWPPLPEHLIHEKLRYFGYDTAWSPVLIELLGNLGNTELLRDVPGLKLSGIPPVNFLQELEFYYPLSRLRPADLKKIFSALDLPGATADKAAYMDQQLDRLTFTPTRGFMRGFIDLVFEFEGKFYLADWKSNHLGSTRENYHRDKLLDTILSGYYFLQYHLYCLALHLFLEKRLPGYGYESHFGGVFYVFIRGVDPDLGPDYGIYHDLPAPATIEMLRAKILAE